MAMVYLLVTGEYSDYSVKGVCSTKERAEALVKEYCELRVEEMELNGIPCPPKGYHCFCVGMRLSSGVVDYHERCDRGETPEFDVDAERIVWTGFARDTRHAIKITNEKRIQELARRDLQGADKLEHF
uniref:DUF7336 domain-containing protein n=1 Tax=viral metagenome TaxID=1070528 RepID=A0A6H2A2D2_9ZZZZ